MANLLNDGDPRNVSRGKLLTLATESYPGSLEGCFGGKEEVRTDPKTNYVAFVSLMKKGQ